MIHLKDGRRLDSLSGQVGQTISHYAPKAHPSPTAGWRAPLADKILEKLGEFRNFPTSVSSPKGMASPRVVENFRIPLKRSESGRCDI
jgi:hypothetical protein